MGRPRKHATPAEAAAAKVASDRQRYLQKKNATTQPQYIAYMPIPSDVPSITPSNLLLRSDCLGQQALKTSIKGPVHPLPLPLPLPLALQPPTFHLRPEEDVVQKEQQEQHNKEAEEAGQGTYTQAYDDAVLAQLDDADSIASSQQLLHEASLFASSSGSGSLPKKQRQRLSP